MYHCMYHCMNRCMYHCMHYYMYHCMHHCMHQCMHHCMNHCIAYIMAYIIACITACLTVCLACSVLHVDHTATCYVYAVCIVVCILAHMAPISCMHRPHDIEELRRRDVLRKKRRYITPIKPLVTGDIISRLTSAAPCPCPKRATESGSPPNASVFSLIQCSAATMSSRA